MLNLFVDALPWQVLRECFADEMPKTHRFFQKGTIFDRNFSVAEYTYPSAAAIETGMYPHHNRVFHDSVAIELHPACVTISERARDAGYATAQLLGSGTGVYNGTTRGYDRLVVSMYRTPAYEGVERVIRHLEGLGDADHFILLHIGDVHPYPQPIYQLPTSVQAQLPLAVRVAEAGAPVPSPYMHPNPVTHCTFRQSIHAVDRALGTLFSYLEQHYTRITVSPSLASAPVSSIRS